MKGLTPQQVQQLRAHLAAGGQLPPGVVAMPQGAAPPGAVDLGQVGNPKEQHPAMAAKAAQNPLPEGDEGIEILRKMSECNLPKEAQKLHALLTQVLKFNTDDMAPEIVEDTDKALADGIMIGITGNRHCRKNLHVRTVVTFDKHEELGNIHAKFLAKEKEVLELKKQFEEKRQEVLNLLQQRWNKAVKQCGLDPVNRFYRINEDSGTIEEIQLRCDECLGARKIKKARQRSEDLVKLYVVNNKETSDDGKPKTQT